MCTATKCRLSGASCTPSRCSELKPLTRMGRVRVGGFFFLWRMIMEILQWILIALCLFGLLIVLVSYDRH